jgi:guanylate kinase
MTDYQPSPAVLAYVRNVDFVGVVGPTAVGKSTLIERAMTRDRSIHLVRSTTSRDPRPGEVDGVDMHFRSMAHMEARRAHHEYITAVQLFGNIYATAPEDCSDSGVSVLPMAAAAAPQYAALPFHSFRTVFILPPSYETWMARIAGRATNELQKRMQEATLSLQFALATPGIVFVLNDDLDIATEEFIAILHGDTPDASQQLACSRLAATLLQRISA